MESIFSTWTNPGNSAIENVPIGLILNGRLGLTDLSMRTFVQSTVQAGTKLGGRVVVSVLQEGSSGLKSGTHIYHGIFVPTYDD